jgi:hypothetical protein
MTSVIQNGKAVFPIFIYDFKLGLGKILACGQLKMESLFGSFNIQHISYRQSVTSGLDNDCESMYEHDDL